MIQKRTLQRISIISSLMVPVGLALWIRGLTIQEWEASERAIDQAWTLIPVALITAIGSGAWAARLPDPEGKRDRTSWILAGIGILLAIGIIVMLLNIRIA